MRVLSLDTSTPRGSVALLMGRELAAELCLSSPETHSARLLGTVDFLLKTAGWRLDDLGLIVAGIGPGSFTGIRIGVATAMGLAQTLSISFAGISSFDAAAHKILQVEGRIGVVLDAQRTQVYYAEFVNEHGKSRKISKPTLLYPADLAARLRGSHLYLVGDGAVRYADEMNIPRTGWPRLLSVDLYLASSMGRLAWERKKTWRSGEFLHSEPLYIRPPDAFRIKVIKR